MQKKMDNTHHSILHEETLSKCYRTMATSFKLCMQFTQTYGSMKILCNHHHITQIKMLLYLTLKSHKQVQSWILSCFWDLKGEKSSYKKPIHKIKVFFNKATHLENEWIPFQNSMQSRRFVYGLLAVFLSFLPFNSFFLKRDIVTSGKKTYLCFRSSVRISFPRSLSASKSCVTSLSTTALTMAGRSEASRSSNKTPWTHRS